MQLRIHFSFKIKKLNRKAVGVFVETNPLNAAEKQISYFQKRAVRSKATRFVVENLTNSIKSGRCRNIAMLIKIQHD